MKNFVTKMSVSLAFIALPILAQAQEVKTLQDVADAKGLVTTYVVDETGTGCNSQTANQWAIALSFKDINNRVQTVITRQELTSNECMSAIIEMGSKGLHCVPMSQGKNIYCGSVNELSQKSLVNGRQEYSTVKTVRDGKNRKIETFFVHE